MIKDTLLSHACPTCKGEVRGRSDKKYCSIPCKNRHHAIERWHFRTPEMKELNLQRKNLKIMDGLVGQDSTSAEIHKISLESLGFNLNYCKTETAKNCKLNYPEKKNYKLLNFEIEEDGSFLKITRSGMFGAVPKDEIEVEFRNMFYRRWLLTFPEIELKDNCKESILASGHVWRE